MSIISHSWLKQCLPECDIWAKFLSMNGLELKAANGTDLPCVGWMKLTFNFIKDDSDHTVTVPFLIAKAVLDVPVVGVNVIEEITKHFDRGSSARVNGLFVVLSEEMWRPLFSSSHLSLWKSQSIQKTEKTVVFVSHLSPEEHT